MFPRLDLFWRFVGGLAIAGTSLFFLRRNHRRPLVWWTASIGLAFLFSAIFTSDVWPGHTYLILLTPAVLVCLTGLYVKARPRLVATAVLVSIAGEWLLVWVFIPTRLGTGLAMLITILALLLFGKP